MLFNSLAFVFIFLPITLVVFHLLAKRQSDWLTILWLVAASMFFYAWWNPIYLALILASLLINYMISIAMEGTREGVARKRLLVFAILGNLAALGYFKYANFFIDNANSTLGTNFNLDTIILPLAISFFTFEQIAYHVDVYKGSTVERSIVRYFMFVVFFPQLIAGPIVHHREMMPQLAKGWLSRLSEKMFIVGATVFTIGLFKKVVLADGIAPYATSVFNASDGGATVTIFQAWCGSFAYAFQLYFDFSGYSDMAIGLALLFGIRLPLNFYSPYKAGNIIEFWNRWHMTLSRFLREYLYVPLGGNRKGPSRRYLNLMVVMVLGGLWHGAGWTFVIWGALHGTYLIVNHIWRAVRVRLNHDLDRRSWVGASAGRVMTFSAVVVAWVFFRAETLDGATGIISAMFGGNGIALPERMEDKLGSAVPWLLSHGFTFTGMFPGDAFSYTNGLLLPGIWDSSMTGVLMIAAMLLVVWFGPNTQQLMMRFDPSLETYRGEIRHWRGQWLLWQPSLVSGVFVGIMIFVSVGFLMAAKATEFLYFNF